MMHPKDKHTTVLPEMLGFGWHWMRIWLYYRLTAALRRWLARVILEQTKQSKVQIYWFKKFIFLTLMIEEWTELDQIGRSKCILHLSGSTRMMSLLRSYKLCNMHCSLISFPKIFCTRLSMIGLTCYKKLCSISDRMGCANYQEY